MRPHVALLATIFICIGSTEGAHHHHSNEISIKCPRNEEPQPCVSPCIPSCAHPYPVSCYFLVCNKGCVCKPGFIRKAPGKECVPVENCRNYCEAHQRYTSCGTACPTTCASRNRNAICTKNCVPGCACKRGYILDVSQGDCILPRNCPKIG